MTSHRPFFPRRPVLPVAATNSFQRRHLQNGLAILRHLDNFLKQTAGVVAQLAERLVRNEKVRGSTPLGSTSLRCPPRCELRTGKPAKIFTL